MTGSPCFQAEYDDENEDDDELFYLQTGDVLVAD